MVKTQVGLLQKNIEILSRHNSEKNVEVLNLLQNPEDYNPIRLQEMVKKETRTEVKNQNYRDVEGRAHIYNNL
jgi:hypothetical protein